MTAASEGDLINKRGEKERERERRREGRRAMEKRDIVRKAEKLVEMAMKGNDASHDAAHVFRVRNTALSLALEEGLSSSPDSMEIVSSYPGIFTMIFIYFVTEIIELVEIIALSCFVCKI